MRKNDRVRIIYDVIETIGRIEAFVNYIIFLCANFHHTKSMKKRVDIEDNPTKKISFAVILIKNFQSLFFNFLKDI